MSLASAPVRAPDQHVRPAHSGMYVLAHVIAIGLVAGYVVLTIPGANPGGFPWWEAAWLNLATLAPAALCWVRGRHTPQRMAWALVSLGILSQLVGDQVWQLFVMARTPLPVVSVADLFWLAFYPLLIGALVVIVRSSLTLVSTARILDGLLAGLATATLVIIVVFPAVLEGVDGHVLRTAIGLAYPVLDGMLLAAVLAVVSVFGWRPPASVWWLGAAMATWTMFDSLYVIRSAHGGYAPGELVDVVGLCAALLAALAPGWRQRATVPSYPRWLPFAAPFFATSSALVVLLVDSVVHVPRVASYLTAATVVASLARLAAAISDALRAGEHEFLALTDDLTGLPNRRSLYEQARRLLPEEEGATRRRAALLLLDLDHFKDVNDSLGHAAGDELLRTMAARMTGRLRREDVLARLGGDEFAVLLASVADEQQAHAVAQRLYVAVCRPAQLHGESVWPSASIGVAPSRPEDTPTTVITRADLALYEAKRLGRGQVALYRPGLEPGVPQSALVGGGQALEQ